MRFMKATQATVTLNGHTAEADPSAEWRADRDLVHEPSRLRIMATTVRSNGATFQDLRTRLGLSDAEVAAHTKKLETAGLLESRREIGGTGVVVSFVPTPRGKDILQGYCDWMRDILDGL